MENITFDRRLLRENTPTAKRLTKMLFAVFSSELKWITNLI